MELFSSTGLMLIGLASQLFGNTDYSRSWGFVMSIMFGLATLYMALEERELRKQSRTLKTGRDLEWRE